MKHNQFNPNFKFEQEPVEFNKFTEKDFLQYCLGGTLYMPATKNIVKKILNSEIAGLTSMVMCFEDAIAERDLPEAEINVINHLNAILGSLKNGTVNTNDIPLTFLRVRNTEQFDSFAEKLMPEQASILSGFVFPKFDSINGHDYLITLAMLNRKHDLKLYGMPILEGRTLAFKETRANELFGIKNLLKPFKDIILNIRVGATDFSSIFGVRRGINYSIYDIMPVRDCLSDVLNFLNREEDDYVISAPVWEYFLADKQDSIDDLLEEDIHRSLLSRTPIINEAIDGLLREVILDKANGFFGKTVIHTSHLKFVNALQAVTKEEYDDAIQILQSDGGVAKGGQNKMNESNPHKNWAQKTINRAKAYGVIENEASYLKLCLG